MKVVACTAAGLMLIATAAPTPSLADSDPHNAMNLYNANETTRSSARRVRARGPELGRRALRVRIRHGPNDPFGRPMVDWWGSGAYCGTKWGEREGS